MANVWVLGNSFSNQSRNDNTWMKQVADRLEYTPHYLAVGGTSLDYTYKTFNDIRPQVLDNDVLILTLTDLNRRWMFKDNPEDAIWTKINVDDKQAMTSRRWVTKGETWELVDREYDSINAVNEYLTYLDNPALQDVYLLNFLHNLQYFVKKHQVHIILLSCFEGIHDALTMYKTQFPLLHIGDKSLISISKEEFEPGEFERSGIMRNIFDLRLNHITRTNHDVMSNKLVDNIKNNEPITLRNGFIKGFLNCEVIQGLEFSNSEGFNVHQAEYYDFCMNYLRGI